MIWKNDSYSFIFHCIPSLYYVHCWPCYSCLLTGFTFYAGVGVDLRGINLWTWVSYCFVVSTAFFFFEYIIHILGVEESFSNSLLLSKDEISDTALSVSDFLGFSHARPTALS